MASELQISRGSLSARDPHSLLEAELFWVPNNASNNTENNGLIDEKRPFSKGDLYIGRPSLGKDRTTYEEPLLIAGEKAGKALTYRGELTTELNILDDRFKYVRTGDFFVFNNDANKATVIQLGDFASPENDFLKGDILLITHADYDIAPNYVNGHGESYNIQFIRINCSGGYAKYTYFDNSQNEMASKNVQDAIDELNHNKVSYKGRITADYRLDELMTLVQETAPDGSTVMVYHGKSNILTQGSLFFVDTDGIKINSYFNGVSTPYTTKKGDFLLWQDDEQGWLAIPSGLSDSSDIDFDPSDAVANQEGIGTFTEDDLEHINSTRNLTNVQEALTYLLSKKAMLDSNGKVPLSQLHQTVLGGLQYKGSWSPELINDEGLGLSNARYQNHWPVENPTVEIDNDTTGDEETTYGRGYRAGDYYIVKSKYTNVQYQDKDSLPVEGTNGEKYSRVLELNTGDFIICNVNNDGTFYWDVIDNSDRISQLNFEINGTYSNSEASYLAEENIYNKSLVGAPNFAASDKLVIIDDNDTMTFAGVRLIDQYVEDDREHEDTYVPVYQGNTDTIKRSTIRNYKDVSGRLVTEMNSNVIIGDEQNTFNEYVYGDIFIRPKFTVSEGLNSRKNTGIKFEVTNVEDNLSNNYTSATLYADPLQKENAEYILPDENSKIIGKLKGVVLISKRLTKSTHDGYIDSSSIEEHMKEVVDSEYSENGEQKYNDTSIVSVEFHAPVVDVNNIETRHITLGQKSILNRDLPNGGEFVNGTFLSTELISEIFAHPSQTTNIVNYLPRTAGILVNTTDLSSQFRGTTDTLPIYGVDEIRPDENVPRKTLIDSKVKQVYSALYDLLYKTNSQIATKTDTLENVSSEEHYTDTDSDFVNKKYGQVITEEVLNEETGEMESVSHYEGTEKNVVLTTDTVIGDVQDNGNGPELVDPKSLLVTKSLLLGNNDTNTTHIVPGKTLFPQDSQYNDPRTEETLPINDVYVELPSVSGVLLTSNSRIDGGRYEE